MKNRPREALTRQLLGLALCLFALLTYVVTLCIVAVFRAPSAVPPAHRRRKLRLLIVGRFDSLNWCRAHMAPLIALEQIDTILAAVDGPLLSHPKLTRCGTPRWLSGLLGRSGGRSVWVLYLTAKHRPDVIMGYHFFPGALSALLAGRIVGARSVYQVTGGPVEILGGGVATESRWLPNVDGPSRHLGPLVKRVCRGFDAIIVRGKRAADFFGSFTDAGRIHVIPGSFSPRRFNGVGANRIYDLTFAGRLVPVKQVDEFLRVVACLARSRPQVRAAVVGDGPLMEDLRGLAGSLGILDRVAFLGHTERVEDVLAQTKTFVLTSRSEGLSIALAEAMAARAVPVVVDVGDLPDLVRHGETGYLVPRGAIETHAGYIARLLQDTALWSALSEAARARAMEHNLLDSVVHRWDRCFSGLLSDGDQAGDATASPVSCLKPPDAPRRGWTTRQYHFWEQRVPSWLKKGVGPALTVVPPQHVLGRRFAAACRSVEQMQWWPAERLQRYQLERLREMCRLANTRSRFYRRLFQTVGFEPEDLRSPDDLGHLPLIDRDVVRDCRRDMLTVTPGSSEADLVSTGGSSGAPLHFHMGANRSTSEYAHLIASWRRVGYQLGMEMAVFRGHTVRADKRGRYHSYDPLLRHHYYSVFHMTDDNMRRYVEHMRRLGPCFLHVYPSAVAALARFLKRSDLAPLKNVRAIIAESEIVHPEQRTMVEEVFGCRYFSCYGHSEKLVLAAECEHSADYHIWPTYGYFELLDEQGQAVTTPGQRGEIVGTGFINTVMPFIRYRTGDYATYVGPHCDACGRQHTVIRDISGHRIQEVLIAEDGSEIPWVALNMHDDTFLNVRQFQFSQDAPGRAVLRIVPAAGLGDEDRGRIQRNLGGKLNGRLRFEIQLVDSIPLSPRGKAIYVDQRIGIARVAAESGR